MPVSMLEARSARANRSVFARRIADELTALAVIANDPDLSADGKRKRMAEPLLRIQRAHAEIHAKTQTLVDAARRDFETRLPRAARLRAVFADPQRATAFRELAEKAPAGELVELARLARDGTLGKPDLAAAYGIAVALQQRVTAETVTVEEHGAVMEVLNSIGGEEVDQALANLFVAAAEADALDDDLARVTGKDDPGKQLERAFERSRVEIGDVVFNITTARAAELYRIADVEQAAPPEVLSLQVVPSIAAPTFEVPELEFA